MARYLVAIVSTITTTIFVEKETAIDARVSTEDYGLIEAISDMSIFDETRTVRIKSVKKA